MDFRKRSGCGEQGSNKPALASERADSWQSSREGGWQPTGQKHVGRRGDPALSGEAQAAWDFNIQGLQQLLAAARDFAPNRAACLLSSPSCPQAGRPSKLDPGVMESRASWSLCSSLGAGKKILFTPTGLPHTHLGDSPSSSVAGTALALKKRAVEIHPSQRAALL